MQDLLRSLGEEDFLRRLFERDASLWTNDPATQERIVQRLGWLSLPELMAERVGELRAFASEVSGAGFRHAVLLGMGGSALAPEVFQKTFGHTEDHPHLIVLDSTD